MLACVVAVTGAAAIQLLWVLQVPLTPLVFAVPVALGAAFGVLIVRIRRAVQRERQLAALLADREAALAELNRELEAKVLQRTRDLEQAHTQLVHAQKLECLGSVAGSVAHDFNNMLTIMVGCTAELELRVAGEPTAESTLAELSGACDRARQITRQLLLFSRREQAQTTVVGLSAMLEALRPMLTRLAGPELDVRVVTETDQAVVCDQSQLEQVVVNLVVNARDVGARNVELTVGQCGASESEGPMARLSVRDDGPGMSPEILRRAREPFFTTKAPGKGTGLGLSVADGVLRAFGGNLELASTLGAGTTVILRMPAVAGGADVAVSPRSQRRATM